MKSISDINTKIAESIVAIRKSIHRRNYVLQEPDYVAALTTEFPKKMTGVIHGVKFGGCFIHQRPYVTFTSSLDGKSHSCELGDMLVVCRQTVDKKESYNASLLQFKKSPNQKLDIASPNELVQLEVYTQWPVLSLRKHSTSYDIQPKAVNMGAQYAEIHIPGGRYSSMYVHIPQEHMNFSSDMTLGRFISNLMEWEDGRTINKEEKKDDEEWSRLIWDLIELTKNAFYNRKNIGHTNRPRAAGEFFNAICDEAISLVDTIAEDESSAEGISILFIDLCKQDIKAADNK